MTEARTQGACIDLRSVPAAERQAAFDAALDYRGDVTLSLEDGSTLECYVFDRRADASPGGGVVRVMATATGERRSIPYAGIARIEFSGKDTAAGKTWDNWVRRYVEKRLAGERASIESDPID
ncbi:MAG: hypothetical protein EBU70_08890 [Actinobacteria bacterium]|nr:hypothetical protein [Actinomycetota bacterium]